jgi:hypothetical protein
MMQVLDRKALNFIFAPYDTGRKGNPSVFLVELRIAQH